MARPLELYLDIETDRAQDVTIVGLYSSTIGLVQLSGPEITRRALLGVLPTAGRLYTFNGAAFDLPKLRAHTGLDLATRFEPVDLCLHCRRCDLTGGQKAIEQAIGFVRRAEVLSYWQIVGLWERYRRTGDEHALHRLLRYNADDLRGMVAIRRHLARLRSPRSAGRKP